MAAALIPAQAPGQRHQLLLPEGRGSAGVLEEVRFGLGTTNTRGPVQLLAGDWLLRVRELRALVELLAARQLQLELVLARRAETLVAAAALGLETAGRVQDPPAAPACAAGAAVATEGAGLMIHRGTLRSGTHLQSEGSVLLLGDLNPGARISAAGHVLVWGRLRGIAHAGRDGDSSARIVALQLRPLQLRIASAVARGPAEAPPDGMAEMARLVNGEIRIDPASPLWPLSA
jgi:septum site-determining protein MinC